MKRTMTMLLLAMIGCVGCAEPAPTTTTDEQGLCRQDQDDCINWPSHCTALGACTDYDVANGFCCPAFKKLPTSTAIGEVLCGRNLDDLPTCISTNHYDFGLVKITCTTVTEWFGDGQGGLTKVQSTSCTYG